MQALLESCLGSASSQRHSRSRYDEAARDIASAAGCVTSVHYVNCADGVSFFADRQGRPFTHEAEIFLRAMRTAEQAMKRLPTVAGWSGWLVCVHDELGQMVEVFDFPNAGPSFSAPWLDDDDRETAQCIVAAGARASSSRSTRAAHSSRLARLAPASGG